MASQTASARRRAAIERTVRKDVPSGGAACQPDTPVAAMAARLAYMCKGQAIPKDVPRPSDFASRAGTSRVRAGKVSKAGNVTEGRFPHDITCDSCRGVMVCRGGTLVCSSCALVKEDYDASVDRSSSGLPYGSCSGMSRSGSNNAYNHLTHFKEWLTKIQGTPVSNLPQEVVEEVRRDLDLRRVELYTDMRDYGQVSGLVMGVLKSKQKRAYYDRVGQITHQITGVPGPRLSPQQESTLIKNFQSVMQVYGSACPNTRSNVISYGYIAYRLMEAMGDMQEFMRNISLLKSNERLEEHDLIWAKICGCLDWEIPQDIAEKPHLTDGRSAKMIPGRQ